MAHLCNYVRLPGTSPGMNLQGNSIHFDGRTSQPSESVSRNGSGTAFTALNFPTLFRCSFSNLFRDILTNIRRSEIFVSIDHKVLVTNIPKLFQVEIKCTCKNSNGHVELPPKKPRKNLTYVTQPHWSGTPWQSPPKQL
jgi:hypothetical protein